jgi:hypothetical protein
MHKILKAHFEAAAEFHEKKASVHAELHGFHKARAKHFEDSGDPVSAAHHREVGNQHAQLAKLHTQHSEHCQKTADGIAVLGEKTTQPDSLQKLFGSNAEQ